MGNKEKVKIIFDTDIGCDCDDAGAMALLHRLCDKGEAELLAVTHCFNSPYYAGCIDSINRFFGRTVPVGVNYADTMENKPLDVYASELCEGFPNSYPPASHATPNGAEDTLLVLRRTLANAEDNSVTLVVTGALNSMARLILSGADGISPLTGRELVEKKLKRTVVMGGRFRESWPMAIHESGSPSHHDVSWEYNIKFSGYENARTVFDNWTGELVLSSYEIGCYIVSMKGYASRAPKADPVARAYTVHNGDVGRCSWDHTAVLEAVRPGVYWNLHEFGKISVDGELITSWSKDERMKHSYLLPKVDYGEIRGIIDELVFVS